MDEAISEYQEALRLDPKDATPHANLGVALASKGRLDEAVQHLEECIRLEHGASPFAHWQLGVILQNKGRLDEAIDHYQKAVQLDHNSASDAGYLFYCLFDSACAAVQASTGKDSGGSDETERARLRRLALERLRAGLELRTSLLKDGKEAGWNCSPMPWQTEPALARVRDPEALAKLSDTEREQWQRLWADVAQQPLLHSDSRGAGPGSVGTPGMGLGPLIRYSRACLGATDDGEFWFEYAAVLLLSGDQPAYNKACLRMIDALW